MAPWILFVCILAVVMCVVLLAMLMSFDSSATPAYKPFTRDPRAPGGGDMVGDLPIVIDAYGRKGRYDATSRKVAEPPPPM